VVDYVLSGGYQKEKFEVCEDDMTPQVGKGPQMDRIVQAVEHCIVHGMLLRLIDRVDYLY